MSAALQAYFDGLKRFRTALHQAAIAAHQTAIAELRLDDETASITGLTDAEKACALAARDLVRAVDGLPMERQPRGWRS